MRRRDRHPLSSRARSCRRVPHVVAGPAVDGRRRRAARAVAPGRVADEGGAAEAGGSPDASRGGRYKQATIDLLRILSQSTIADPPRTRDYGT